MSWPSSTESELPLQVWSTGRNLPRPFRQHRRRGPRLAIWILLILAACTATTEQVEGELRLGEHDAEIQGVDCAETRSGLALSGVATTSEGAELRFDLAEATLTVEVTSGDLEGADRLVLAEAQAERDEGAVEIAGEFLEFAGAERTGQLSGALAVSCPADADPGGGFLASGGQEVSYELVSCISAPDRFEARAVSGDGRVTLVRTRAGAGWLDRVEATGEISWSLTEPVSDPGSTPEKVRSGLFGIQGSRLRMDRADDDPALTLDLTCGIDVQVQAASES